MYTQLNFLFWPAIIRRAHVRRIVEDPSSSSSETHRFKMLLRNSLLIVVCICFEKTVLAQGPGLGVNVGPAGVRLMGFGEIDVEATINQWTTTEKQRMESFLELQIDLLTLPCELTETQIDKLRLLSKGVVTRKLTSGEEQLKQFMMDSTLIPSEAANGEAPAPTDKLWVTGARKDNDRNDVVLFRTRFEKPLFEHSLWQGVLKANLTEDQFKKYENFCRDRNKNFVKSAVFSSLAEIDGLVCLTSTQREKIEELWLTKLYSQITVSFPTNLEEAINLTAPVIADPSWEDAVLSPHQKTTLAFKKDSNNWVGVGWVNR